MKMLLVVLFSVLMSAVASAQGAEIEDTISSQIEAFENDDFEKAFSYASPNIQQLFGTPDRFGAMVRQGYPMVWRPGAVRFLELREINGMLWQKVQVTDRNGRLHILDYLMIDGENGWQINGVQILPAPDLAV